MNWHACLLNDIADVVTKGTTPTTLGYQFTDDGVNFIKAEALNGDTSLDRDGFSFISNRANDALARSILQEGDVLVTIAGANIGRCGYVCVDYLPANTNQAVGIIRINKNVAHPKFIYYWFKLESTFGLIQSMGGQAAQPNINLATLKRLSVELPPLEQQCSIVRRLELFDDLIENNRRRMAKLEEAARLLYQEWFVRLRFPGHERTRIVNGVPEGWRREPLENVMVLQRGFDLPSHERVDGIVPIYASTGINGYHNKSMVQGPGVVTGRSGSLGVVLYVSEDYWPLNTTLWVKEFKLVNPEFAVFLLRALNLNQYSGGVSVPTLDRRIVHRIEVVLPDQTLVGKFGVFAADILKQLAVLRGMNEKLRAARDLLLPRLMSGEIAV